MKSVRFSIFLGLLVGWFVGPTSLEAQNLQSVISGLFAPSRGGGEKEPSASEQLEWAEGQGKEAEAKLREATEEMWRARLNGGGWSAEQRAAWERAAKDLVETWVSAVGTLQAVVLREELASRTPPPPPVPQTREEADALQTRAEEIRRLLAQFEVQQTALQELVVRAQQEAALHGREAQAAAQGMEEASGDEVRSRRAAARLEVAEVQRQLAEAQIFSWRWQQYREELERKSLERELEAISATLKSSGLDQVLSKEKAKAQLAAIEAELPKLQSALEEAERQLAEVSARVNKLREENARNPTARAKVEAALSQLDLREVLHRILRGRVMAARQANNLWQRVAALPPKPSIAELDRAREQTAADLKAVASGQIQLDHRLSELRRQEENLERQLKSPAIPERSRAQWRSELEGLQGAQKEGITLKAQLQQLEATHRRILAALEGELERLRREQTLEMAWHRVQTSFSKFWNTQLLAVGGMSLSLGMIITVTVALLAAVLVARLLSVQFSQMAARRFRLAESQTHLIEKLALYTLTLIFTFTVLQWFKIPLTIFAFLGGALAVGVGFGSQNLVNNFISGLLLLLERKINVGDLVEVEGKTGRVTSLGSRCSTIRLFDGVEVLVPNSLLLEKIVINWTLSDPLHRYEVKVGFSYQCKPEEVFEMLEEALRSQPSILRHPAPGIYLANFGESSLDFLIFYWLEVGGPNPLEVGSDLRRTIERMSRERGLEIPVPQRDVRICASDSPGNLVAKSRG